MKSRKGYARWSVVLATMVGASLALSACTTSVDANDSGRTQIDGPFSAAITDRLDAAVAEAMILSGSSGAIVGVWAPWAGKWVVSPGTTTMEGTTPLTTDMRFRIGTNTTSMTCTVLLKLVDAGRVSLSDTVSTYLARSAGVEDITLGQLCQNTSGLADYYTGLAHQFVNNPTREWPPLEVVSSGLASARVADPGGAWAQSSTGIVLLGLVLQSATNQDWASLYRQYIFEPLGMNDTSFPASNELEIPGSHPHGYTAAVNPSGQLVCETLRDATELSNSMSWVAGGVISTVPDMKKWAQALAEGSLLSDKSADAQWATVPQGVDSPSWRSYGLGAQQAGPLRGYGGMIPGFISATFADPSSGLTVVVMLNNSSAGEGFARTLGLRLAAIAAKAPSAGDEKAPLLELPWSEEQTIATMQAAAVCQPPAEAVPAG